MRWINSSLFEKVNFENMLFVTGNSQQNPWNFPLIDPGIDRNKLVLDRPSVLYEIDRHSTLFVVFSNLTPS